MIEFVFCGCVVVLGNIIEDIEGCEFGQCVDYILYVIVDVVIGMFGWIVVGQLFEVIWLIDCFCFCG